MRLHIFFENLVCILYSAWKPNGLEKRVYMPRIIKEKKKHTGRHKRTSNGKSMQQQCTLSIVWSQAFSFPASLSRYYYRAKWLPGRFYSRFEFQFGHSSTGGPTLMPFSLQRIPFLAKIQNCTNKKSGKEILLLSKFFLSCDQKLGW